MQNPFDRMAKEFPYFLGFVVLLYSAFALKYLAWYWILIPACVIIPTALYAATKAESEKRKIREERWQRNKDSMLASTTTSGSASPQALLEQSRQILSERQWEKDVESSIDRQYKVHFLCILSLLLLGAILLKVFGHAFK